MNKESELINVGVNYCLWYTGATFGLRLTFDSQQYEYMLGPNTDAGVKVYLHDQQDVPMVRNLGFAISTGLHGLVAAKLSVVGIDSFLIIHFNGIRKFIDLLYWMLNNMLCYSMTPSRNLTDYVRRRGIWNRCMVQTTLSLSATGSARPHLQIIGVTV